MCQVRMEIPPLVNTHPTRSSAESPVHMAITDHVHEGDVRSRDQDDGVGNGHVRAEGPGDVRQHEEPAGRPANEYDLSSVRARSRGIIRAM